MEQNLRFRNKSLYYDKLIFGKGDKRIKWSKNSLFNRSGAGKPGSTRAKEKSWTPTSHHIQKLPQNGSNLVLELNYKNFRGKTQK